MYPSTLTPSDLSYIKHNSFLHILTRELLKLVKLNIQRRVKIYNQENIAKIADNTGVIVIANHVHKTDP